MGGSPSRLSSRCLGQSRTGKGSRCFGRFFTNMEGTVSNIYATEYIDGGNEVACPGGFCGERDALLADCPPNPNCAVNGGQYPRLVRRDGETNVTHKDTRSRQVLTQWGFVFHVLIGMNAWKLVLLFFLSYIASYFVVGAAIWCAHGAKGFHGVKSYWEAVIFTGYTMTTVGLGNQYPKDNIGNILPIFAVVFGLLMDAFWLGVIFARIASPRPLRHTILFSKRAVLVTEPGDSCSTFQCRLVNLRVRYPWIDLSIVVTLALWDEEHQMIVMKNLQVANEAAPFLDCPWMLRHRVNDDSPLKEILADPSKFENQRGEIIIELNGQDPLTGNCMKKRFSYVASEIFRDYKFVNVMKTDKHAKDTCEYVVDLTHFHDLEPITRTSHDILSSPASSQVYGACGQTEAPMPPAEGGLGQPLIGSASQL